MNIRKAMGLAPSIDHNEVRRALSLWMDPGDHHELRFLPSGRSKLVSHATLDHAVTLIAEQSDYAHGVYATLNPVRADLGDRAAREGDVTSRKFFLIDVDTKRAAKDASSTDAEKEQSYHVAERVRQHLDGLGWPQPIVLDSGNGWHLLYRIDLPNDALAKQWLKRCLLNLSERFSNEHADIDTKVHNASRISKIPGTWVRKGEDTPERPHRMARLVAVPVALAPVEPEQIQALAGLGGKKEAKPTADDIIISRTKDDAYGRAALLREIGAVSLAKEGERNDTLNRAAFNLGQLVTAGHLKEDLVLDALETAALSIGLSPDEIERTVDSGYRAGRGAPRDNVPEVRDRVEFKKGQPKELPKVEGLVIVRASTIKPARVEWVWPGRIPKSKMTTFAGQGGLGKTFVLCDITARITTGAEWPFSGGECADPGQVLFISGEDDPDDTLVPRLIECGADLDNVSFLGEEALDKFSLANLPMLTQAVEQMGDDLKIVVIDPPTSYLSGIDDHKNGELRTLLTPLKHWARAHGVGVIFNTHVNKATSVNIDAAARVMGSVAWVNAVRAAYMFMPDADDPSRRLFLNIKINNRREPKGLVYTIEETRNDLARVKWLGETDTTANEAIKGGKPKRITAVEFLISTFKALKDQGRPLEVISEDLWRSAKEHGIGRDAIFAAKAALNMPKARKETYADGDAAWTWWVPPDWPPMSSGGG